ncbi:hypothetical protein G6O69_17735 [Pseudenhygromyxa sp. WMMC2535]|uniref:hypothetical protein n=1 Tax=Pseudenhygromyxa sp. WMMC2535 TaxID=2712867 RepID=UPI00155502CD|nr:hypothetical protein [Pseudenhygromyxa sp. WMMC2535]NVB39689.1 hypothetical protein [Pseudenhygromyxa sp. WMMC2535]
MHREAIDQGWATSPWAAPVPLRPGGFSSLDPAHAAFDLVTDLGQLTPFGVPKVDAARVELLGYADYQLDAELPHARRQGAGRAVFFHDPRAGETVYLKGVGRTPLALNWSRPRELTHATGHMPASAGVRELVASRYLRAKGLGELIVPCEGLLVRAMAPEFAANWRAALGAAELAAPACDRHLQAISVKPGEFARWSNILWLAHHSAPLAGTLSTLGEAIARFVRGPGRPRLRPEDCTPERLAAELEAAFTAGWARLAAALRHGVHWCSYHNNFTLDGRFLDLELPVLLGEGLCAKVITSRAQGPVPAELLARAGDPMGWELGNYRRQVRLVIDALGARLRQLSAMARSSLVAEFAGALASALDARFPSDHLLRDAGRMRAELRGLYLELGASAAELPALLEHIACEERLDQASADFPAIPCRLSAVALPRPELGVRARLATIGAAPGPRCPQAAHERALLAELFAELDGIADAEDYLDRLRGWLERVDAEVRPAAPAVEVA